MHKFATLPKTPAMDDDALTILDEAGDADYEMPLHLIPTMDDEEEEGEVKKEEEEKEAAGANNTVFQ